MDLGTILRNLKNLHYNSKKEFVHDLMLIWSNCFLYNSHPDHPLRVHAQFMKDKSLELINLIPDIVIQSRKDYDDSLIEAELESDEESTAETSKHVTSKKTSSRGGQTQQAVEVHTDANSPEENNTPVTKKEVETSKPPAVSGSTPPVNEAAVIESSNTLEKEPLSDVATEYWKIKTKDIRESHILNNRRILKSLQFIETELPMIRKPTAMSAFIDREVAYGSIDCLPMDKGDFEPIMKLDTTPLLEYDVGSGVPMTAGSVLETESEEDLYFRDYSLFEINRNTPGVPSLMYKNIAKMQEIRKLCNKIQTVRQLQLPQPFYYEHHKSHVPFANNEPILLDIPQNYDNMSSFKPLAHDVLKKLCTIILFHAGFESFQMGALDALTEIAADYMAKMGAVMDQYLIYGKDKSQQVFNYVMQLY